jgi:hypothetical protein
MLGHDILTGPWYPPPGRPFSLTSAKRKIRLIHFLFGNRSVFQKQFISQLVKKSRGKSENGQANNKSACGFTLITEN